MEATGQVRIGKPDTSLSNKFKNYQTVSRAERRSIYVNRLAGYKVERN